MTRLALELSLPAVAALKSGGAAAASAADTLLGAETNGLAFAASDNSMTIRDTTTPANNYSGSAITKFGSVRASAGTYINSSGIIASSVNGLRIDYDPRAAGAKFLFEQESTNLHVKSQDFTDTATYYLHTAISATANTVVAPDGTTTGNTIIEDTANNSHGLRISSGFASAATATGSVFFKAGTSNFGFAGIFNGSKYIGCTANFSTGAITETAAGVTGRIVPYTNGWHRLEVSVTTAAATSYFWFGLSNSATPGDGDGFGRPSYVGTSRTIHPWGAMYESGAIMASSYIPTTTAAVTRAVDAPTIPTTTFRWVTATSTLYAKYALKHNTGTSNYSGIYSQNVIHNQISCYAGTPSCDNNNDASIVWGSAPAALSINKIAGAEAANNFGLCVNGGTALTDATGTIAGAPTSLIIGGMLGSPGYLGMHGWIFEGMHLPRRMSNAELVTVTTL